MRYGSGSRPDGDAGAAPGGERPPSIEQVHAGLHRALRHGAHAAHLVRYAPALVDVLGPAADGDYVHERALAAEERIRQAISALGRPDVLGTLPGLEPGTYTMKLEERRQRAASALGILPETFRRESHEGPTALGPGHRDLQAGYKINWIGRSRRAEQSCRTVAPVTPSRNSGSGNSRMDCTGRNRRL